MKLRLLFTLLVPAAACGGENGGSGADAAEGARVTIDAAHTRLVAARTAGGTWTVLTPDAGGYVDHRVSDAFEVVAVCADFGNTVIAFRAGPEDLGTPFVVDCPTPQVFVRLSNGLNRAARFSVDRTRIDLEPGQAEMVSVPAGLRDVVVEDVARGLAGVARRVELADGGMAMIAGVTLEPIGERPFTAPDNAAGVVTSVFESASGTAAIFSGPSGTAYAMSATVSEPSDRHTLAYREFAIGRSRERVHYLDAASDGSVDVAVAPFITDVTPSDGPTLALAYDVAGDWPQRTVIAFSGNLTWRVKNHPGAGDPAGTVRVPDPTTIPGWDPAWTLRGDVAGAYSVALGLHREDTEGRDDLTWDLTWPPLPVTGSAAAPRR